MNAAFGKKFRRLWRRCRRVWLPWLGVLLLPATQAVAQNEIAAFNLVSVDGSFSAGYEFDERTGNGSLVSSQLWKEALYVRTRSYVYHPALLVIDLSGSPKFQQYEYSSGSGDTSGSKSVFDYSLNMDFLSRKPYPFRLFTRRSHPNISTGQSARYQVATDEYGIKGILRAPLSPLHIDWNVQHSSTNGAGFDAVTNSSTDSASMRTNVPYGEGQNLSLDFDWTEFKSQSGSTGLPIQATLTETKFLQLIGKNVFGGTRQVTIDQRINVQQQHTEIQETSEIDRLLYTAQMRLPDSSLTNTQVFYKYIDFDRDNVWSRGHDLNASSAYRPWDKLGFTGSFRYSNTDDSSFSRDRFGVTFGANSTTDLSFGQLSVNGSVQLDRTDQNSSADTARIFDEAVALTGVMPAALGEEFIVEGSIVVTNEDRTQTFLEESDYRLVTTGATTTIERIITGGILDGQVVLVSYEYQTAGTVKFGTRGLGASAQLDFSNNASVFVNVFDSNNDVVAGESATAVNNMSRIQVGGRLQRNFSTGWSVAGDLRYTAQDEDISSYRQTSLTVNIQSPRFWNSVATVGLSRDVTDIEDTLEDRDFGSLTFTLSSRLPGGIALNYSTIFSRDYGGTIAKDSLRQSLRMNWRYRQLALSLVARHSKFNQGPNSRGDTQVMVDLRRWF